MKPVRAIVLPLVCATVLSGCATSADVLPVGPDTYTVSAAAAPVRGGSSAARGIALSEANQYCQKLGKQILVTNISAQSINRFGAGDSDITFRCLSPNDPDLKRPVFEQSPNLVIENRTR